MPCREAASRFAPSCARRSSSSPAFSCAPISTVDCASTGPSSMPLVMRKTEAPVNDSPAQIARCTGAAPRHCGSSEKCKLYHPNGNASSTGSLSRRPYATTAPASAPVALSAARNVSSLGSHSMTGSPSSSAACLTGLGMSLRPRPAGASGRVNTATTSKCSVSCASLRNEGTAASGVPANSTRTIPVPPRSVSWPLPRPTVYHRSPPSCRASPFRSQQIFGVQPATQFAASA